MPFSIYISNFSSISKIEYYKIWLNTRIQRLKNRIEFFRDAINRCYRNGRGAISSDIDINDLVNTEKDVVSFMQQIKGEIPLPYLQEQIDKFILEYSKSKKDNKVKKLQ